jgi:hypothetical protein
MKTPGSQYLGPSASLVSTKETPQNKERDPNAPAVEGDIQKE